MQLVLPDTQSALYRNTTPVSRVDFSDAKLARAYRKYYEAKRLLDSGQVARAFALFVDERCLLLDMYNRYYSTMRSTPNVADPKEAAMSRVTNGCSN